MNPRHTPVVDAEAIRYEKAGLWVGGVGAVGLDRSPASLDASPLIGVRLSGEQNMVGSATVRLVLDVPAAAALIAHIRDVAEHNGMGKHLAAEVTTHGEQLAKLRAEEAQSRHKSYDLGRAAYEAYQAACGGRSLASGETLPPWLVLPHQYHEAWASAAWAAAATHAQETASQHVPASAPRDLFQETADALSVDPLGEQEQTEQTEQEQTEQAPASA